MNVEAKRSEIVQRAEQDLGVTLVNEGCVYKSDCGTAVTALVSSEKDGRFWFGFYLAHRNMLDKAKRAYAMFYCVGVGMVRLPRRVVLRYLGRMSITVKPNSNKSMFCHVNIKWVPSVSKLFLVLKGGTFIDITKYMRAENAQ
jgi:hypothetical protein